jgi:hypothetical protein
MYHNLAQNQRPADFYMNQAINILWLYVLDLASIVDLLLTKKKIEKERESHF